MAKQAELIAAPIGGVSQLSTQDLKSYMLKAIEHGGTDAVEVVERLLGVAERVRDAENVEAMNRDYAAFCLDRPKIFKTKRAGNASDSGMGLSWMYAPLEELHAKLEPVANNHRLFYGWDSDDSGEAVRVTCILSHTMGASRKATVTVRKTTPNRAQTVAQCDAMALTTGQRRSMCMVLGVVATDDEPPALPPVETITPEQAATITEYLHELKMNDNSVRRFLSWAGAARVSDIADSEYERVIAKLKDLEAKAKVQE